MASSSRISQYNLKRLFGRSAGECGKSAMNWCGGSSHSDDDDDLVIKKMTCIILSFKLSTKCKVKALLFGTACM